jgi:hypothetical protein
MRIEVMPDSKCKKQTADGRRPVEAGLPRLTPGLNFEFRILHFRFQF